jgi:hypothetical protein
MQKKELVDDGRRKVSYSQYTIWSTCPHQWKLAYHDKLKPTDKSIHLIFGTAIHDTIQTWLEKRYNGREVQWKYFDWGTFFKDRLFELFNEEMVVKNEDGTVTYYVDKPTLKEFYIDGLAILEHIKRYHKEYFPPKAELIGCEVPLELPLNSALKFVGYIDLVVRLKDGTIIIYDFKTSGKGWFHEKKDPKKINQILLYKRFYSEVYEISEDKIEVQFLILKRKVPEVSEWPIRRISKFEPASGKTSVKKAVASFDEFVKTTFDDDGTVLVENLKPKPSEKNCRFCPFRENKELCPDGHYKVKK